MRWYSEAWMVMNQKWANKKFSQLIQLLITAPGVTGNEASTAPEAGFCSPSETLWAGQPILILRLCESASLCQSCTAPPSAPAQVLMLYHQ